MIYIKNKIRAIIFDMDGTIIRTDHVYDKVVKALLKEKGFDEIPADKLAVYDALAGVSLKDASAVLKDLFELKDTVDHLVERKIQLANEFLSDTIAFVDGFENFHKQLREHGIPSAIATNSYPDNLKKIDESINLKQFFGDHLYSIGDVNFVAKPDPTLFRHAAERLGVKPEDCIVFEDSVPGFNAARAAGMKCIAIKNDHNKNLLDMVHYAIEDYDEAVDALKKIV